MARKRMFDIEIINQDSFLDLPSEAIALYFLLGMNADDEGFIAPKRIMRLYNIANDTLKVLISKNYVIPFESGVVVITDWKRNNYLDINKIKPTMYIEEKKLLDFDTDKQQYTLNLAVSMVKPKLNQSLTEVKQKFTQSSIEENSIEENSIDKNSIDKSRVVEERKEKRNILVELYNSTCSNLPRVQKITEKRNKAIDKFIKEFTEDEIQEIFIIANNSDFLTGNNDRNWKADFDFIMRIDKATAILEGKYSMNKSTSGFDDFKEIWGEAIIQDEQTRDSTNNNFTSW